MSTTASDMSCIMSDANANSASSFSFHSSNDDQNFPLIWLKYKYLLWGHLLFMSEIILMLINANEPKKSKSLKSLNESNKGKVICKALTQR